MLVLKPEEIEAKSFEIITSRLNSETFNMYSKDELEVVKRVIHTTADFDYQNNMIFQNNALEYLKSLIKSETMLFTDTNMALSGINKRILTEKYNIEPLCLIADPSTMEIAKEKGITRASAAIDSAYKIYNKYNMERSQTGQSNVSIIFAVGNAPTAIIRINELWEDIKPDFIIAAPVGFVNVLEAKALVKKRNIPAIICDGNKGGSNVCAAIINAMLLQLNKHIS